MNKYIRLAFVIWSGMYIGGVLLAILFVGCFMRGMR